MKRFIAFLIVSILLTVSVYAETAVLLDASQMDEENQFTQDPAMVFSIENNKMNIYLDSDLNSWGWIIFDEYKHTYSWGDYEGLVVRATALGENPIKFGISGLFDGAQTARVEYSQSDIVAYTVDGKDVSKSFTNTTSMRGPDEDEWGNGDPCFVIPAGFDGYIFLPTSGAFMDPDCDIDAINNIACFLFDITTDQTNSIQIEYISLYNGNTKAVLEELEPSLAKTVEAEPEISEPVIETEVIEVSEEAVEAPEAAVEASEEIIEAPVVTETVAPQTADILGITAVTAVISFAGAVISKKKSK